MPTIDNRPTLNWEETKTFKDEDSGIALVLSRSDGFRPRYSTKIVRVPARHPTPRPSNHIGIFVRAENGKVKVQDIGPILAKLCKEMKEFVEEEAQKREDDIIEGKIEREERDMNRDKPKQCPGLKLLSKLDKAGKAAGK